MRVSVCEHQKRSQHLHLKKSMAARLSQPTTYFLIFIKIDNTFKTSDIYLITNNQTLTSDNID